MSYLLLKILITLICGTVSGLIFKKLKIPGALLAGSLTGAAILNIFTPVSYMPHNTKILVQIIAGAFIGCSMEKSDLKRLPKILKPAVIMLSALFFLNMTAGILIYITSPLDMITSLMSAVPGGISDTPIIASDMGADGPKVAVMQLIRQILGIGVFPSMIYLWDKKYSSSNDFNNSANRSKRIKTSLNSMKAFTLTIFIASVAGILGRISSIPSATFVFPVISVLILKLKFDFAYIPRKFKKFAQILSGCCLGSTVSFSDITELRYLLLPIVIIVLFYAANCFITGTIISRTCGFTQKEGMLITTPAGASDMALISSDLGVENTDIIILQVIRAVFVMTFFPQIIGFITSFIN